MTILLIGQAGSGKDTQAAFLKEKFGFEIISTGDLVREEIEKETDLGNQITRDYKVGKWVDDKIVHFLLYNKIKSLKTNKIVLTGAVRTPAQVELLDDTLRKLGRKLDSVILLELDEETAINRMKNRLIGKDGKVYHAVFNPPPKNISTKKRDIDKDVNIMIERFKEFKKNNSEIEKSYEERGILRKVDAGNTIKEINKLVLNALNLNEENNSGKN